MIDYKPLIDFALAEAYCPCCTGVKECVEGCTIEKDSKKVGGSAEERYYRMIIAREGLKAAGI